MGLDMYLTKKVYVKNWEHTPEEKRSKISANIGGKEIDTSKVSYLIEDVHDWRKANAIHGWFVGNVQNNVDDCKEYYVEYDQLMDLKTICERLLELYDTDKNLFVEYAEQCLPATKGFFFGSYEYNEWYIEDLKSTINAFESLDPTAEYYYQSSW